MPLPDGVEIDIFEKRQSTPKGLDVVVPNAVRINGQEVLIADEPITINQLSHRDIATVNLTLIVKRLSVHSEQETKTKTHTFGGNVVHTTNDAA